jgi:hypothetical protein
LQLGLDLFEGLGGHLFVERGEDGLALGGGQVFENIGQVGGVHLGQPLVLDAQLDAARRIDLDDVDKLPGNAAEGELARELFQRGARQQALEDAAEGAAQPHLDLGHAQQVSRALAHPLQIDVVDADHLAAVNVDDLAVDQVLLQVEVIALILQRNHGAGRAQLERAGGRLHHILRGHDAQAVAGLEHQAGHLARILAGGHGDVLEPPAQVALGIGHRSAEQRAPENLLRGTGRGIFLIRSFMDEVHFRQLHPGTELTLVKRLTPVSDKTS